MNYTREEILGLRLRASAGLRRLSRRELFSRLQLVRTLEPLVDASYHEVLGRRWRNKERDSPHGHRWHVSYHASQFPGDDPKACSRQSMYRMMDLHGDSATSRWLHMTAEVGKAIEVDLVTILHESGLLISAPPDAEVQTGFEIPDLRFTGSVDSAIVRRNRPTPVEIKTKHEDVIAEMMIGMRNPDQAHIKQVKTQMGLIRNAQETEQLWQDFDLCDRGYVYYLARDSSWVPGTRSPTAEFLVDYDPVWFETGLKVLKDWCHMWDEEILEEQKPGKRTTNFGHPHGWRWSYEPCQFCSYKKVCQKDFRAGITDLAESHGIRMASDVNEDYSYDEARERVKARWATRTRA